MHRAVITISSRIMGSKKNGIKNNWLSPLLFSMLLYGVKAFQSGATPRSFPCHTVFAGSNKQRYRTTKTTLRSSNYGRGAEIWPECNEGSVLLSDSFPNGAIPGIATEALTFPNESSQTPTTESKKKTRISSKIYRILRGAAKGQENEAFTQAQVPASLNKFPALIAFTLLFGKLISPIDVLMVSFLSGYLALVGQLVRSTRQDGSTPVMPSLPPQGHVPALVSNPLGHVFTNSEGYRLWLKLGAVVGLFAPLAMILRYIFGAEVQTEAARACARPVFLLCCQATSEAFSRRLMAPLPLRIFIPAAYNAIRLGPLWNWALSPIPLGQGGRILAVGNLLYWTANLFGFLIPIAIPRYMRAHFLCVEAEEVTTRTGLEDSIGLLQ